MIAHALVYRCPHCGTAVEVPGEVADQVVVCPSPTCGKPFQAKLPGACPVEGDGQASAPAAPSSMATPPAAIPANGTPAANARPATNGPPAANPAPAPVMAPAPAPVVTTEPTLPQETVLEIVRVSMWRRYPFRCMAYLLVIIASSVGAIVALNQDLNVVAGVAAVVLVGALVRVVPWWVRMRNTALTITNRRCILETGVLHRVTTEFERGDALDVQVAQSGLMRLFDVGDLVISSGTHSRKQAVIMAVPDPTTVASHLRDLNVAGSQSAAGQQQQAQPQQV